MLVSRAPQYNPAQHALLELDILLSAFFLHPADRLTIEPPHNTNGHFAQVRLWQGEATCGEILGIGHTSVLVQIQRVAKARNCLVFDLRRSAVRLKPTDARLPTHQPVRGTVAIERHGGLYVLLKGNVIS